MSKTKAQTVNLGTFELNPSDPADVNRLGKMIEALQSGNEYVRPLKKKSAQTSSAKAPPTIGINPYNPIQSARSVPLIGKQFNASIINGGMVSSALNSYQNTRTALEQGSVTIDNEKVTPQAGQTIQDAIAARMSSLEDGASVTIKIKHDNKIYQFVLEKTENNQLQVKDRGPSGTEGDIDIKPMTQDQTSRTDQTTRTQDTRPQLDPSQLRNQQTQAHQRLN